MGDLKNDEYEYGRSYTLKVTVQWDTDGANELDTEYFADRCLLVEDKLLGSKEWELHVAQAAKKLAAKTISVGTSYTGQLSYEGDIDFYKFNNPCPNADCTLAIAYNVSCAPSSGGVTRYCQDPKEVAKGPGLEHIFAIRRTSGDDPYAEIWTGFEAKPGASGEWGATAAGGNLCVYSYKSHGSEPYYLTVEDTAHNFWSLSCKYTFTIKKVADGCVAPCKVHPVSGNCGA